MLSNFTFLLNTPHVYDYLEHKDLVRLRPDMASQLNKKSATRTIKKLTKRHSNAKKVLRRTESHRKRLQGTQMRCNKQELTSRSHSSNWKRKAANALQQSWQHYADAILRDGDKTKNAALVAQLLNTKNRIRPLHVHDIVYRNGNGHQRKWALKQLAEAASRLKLQLPVRSVTFKAPWPGGDQATKIVKDAVNSLTTKLITSKLMQHSAIYSNAQSSQINLKYLCIMSRSIIEQVRTAGKFNHIVHAISPLDCKCHLFKQRKLDNILQKGPDGHQHIFVRQSKFPWKQIHQQMGELNRAQVRLRVVTPHKNP